MAEQKESKPQAGSEMLTVESSKSSSGEIGGLVQMSSDVVARIAGLAARQVPGIHALGRSRMVPFGGSDPGRGVAAEVGQREAAIDLEVIIDHGCNIREVARDLRQRISTEVDKMTGRKVVEVNIDVVGINLPGAEKPVPTEPTAPPRVQ